MSPFNAHQKHSMQSIAIVFLLLLFAASGGFYLYRIHQLEDTHAHTLYQAEAMYQRSLGELTASVKTMHHQLAQLLVTSGKEQILFSLSNLWREVYAAIQSLGALPVSMHELEQTDYLLHDMAEYSYHLMKKNVLSQQPLSMTDWQHLEDFYHRTKVVQKELEQLETAMLSDSFSFTAISLEDETNPVYTAFQSIETQVRAFPAIQFEEGVRKIEPTPLPISGTQISEAEAISIARTFLQTLSSVQTKNSTTEQYTQGQIAFAADNAQIPVYGVQFNNNHYVEVSQIGGHVLQYYHIRETNEIAYTAQEAKTQAYQILDALQFADMVCVEQKEDNHTASFVFVPQQEQVYLYPDMVKLQIALTDGTLLSFDQTNYLTRHHKRTLPAPAISKESILKSHNPNFQVNAIHLALIADSYSSREILAYELIGTIKDEAFSIFFDALTREELRIVRH